MILDPTKWWECPSCAKQHVTTEPRPHTPLHPCPKQRGLLVPFVQVTDNAGIRRGSVRHVVQQREDYVGGEKGLRYDAEGLAVTAVLTERADGSNDCHVFPGVASASSER